MLPSLNLLSYFVDFPRPESTRSMGLVTLCPAPG